MFPSSQENIREKKCDILLPWEQMSRSQKSFWGGRKVRARNALAIRKGRDWANTIYFNFTQVVSSYANFLQQMKAFTREKSSISTGVFRLATESKSESES